jgi:GH18 family chitinase
MTPTPVSTTFRIIAYVTEAVTPVHIQYDKLTHINYAFLIPNKDGTFKNLNNPWKLKEIVQQAHEHDVKVIISVGGWGWDTEFEAVAADPGTRAAFVEEVTRFAAEYGLDGVDMDWEYPDPGQSAQNFLALMQELRAALPHGKLLTAAVVALGDYYGLGIPVEAFALMDFVNIMTYDGEGPNHSSMEYAQGGLDYWLGRGLPPEKAVLGVPFYARPNGTPYAKIVAADPQAANQDFYNYFGVELNYNGIPTIQAKTRLALERASGIMFWTLEQDASGDLSLLNAIYQVVSEEQP